jgi:hypothetical protein
MRATVFCVICLLIGTLIDFNAQRSYEDSVRNFGSVGYHTGGNGLSERREVYGILRGVR